MKLILQRHTYSSAATIGDLSVDGGFFCKTLEDADRQLECGGEKVYGKTAIPRGNYDVILDWSQRFKSVMPHILNVPGFEGVRIHAGNKPEDTEGCVLVGAKVLTDSFISDSRVTFSRLSAILDSAYQRGETITLEVK